MQELDLHASYVNSVCFDDDGSKMYSGDSVGQIRMWNVYVTDKPSSRGVLREWSLNRTIDEPEIKVCGSALQPSSFYDDHNKAMYQ